MLVIVAVVVVVVVVDVVVVVGGGGGAAAGGVVVVVLMFVIVVCLLLCLLGLFARQSISMCIIGLSKSQTYRRDCMTHKCINEREQPSMTIMMTMMNDCCAVCLSLLLL